MIFGKLFGKPAAEKPGSGAGSAAESAAAPANEQGKKPGFLSRFFSRGLAKTRRTLLAILPFGRKLDAQTLDDIAGSLVQADFGPATAEGVTEELRQAYRDREFTREEVLPFLKSRLAARLGVNPGIRWAAAGPSVIVVAGVNGTGKTTSIAKLAHLFRQEGKRVILAAADTFRAAAVEQLAIWSERSGVELVRGAPEGDPSAVVFDAVSKAIDGKYDVLIVDTAGRLHTEKNLMAQLSKMVRVIQKKIPDAPHEVLQVLDATVGQNAIQQAQEFKRAIQVTGIVLTKLDGTARGGVIFPILEQAGIPVKFIGVGEGMDDLQEFEPGAFVEGLFE